MKIDLNKLLELILLMGVCILAGYLIGRIEHYSNQPAKKATHEIQIDSVFAHAPDSAAVAKADSFATAHGH